MKGGVHEDHHVLHVMVCDSLYKRKRNSQLPSVSHMYKAVH